jgi:hypothetical protein
VGLKFGLNGVTTISVCPNCAMAKTETPEEVMGVLRKLFSTRA